jgi:2-iminobutanoate/2-iminopropanoate deaminase
MKEQVLVKDGPKPVGPYSLAIKANGLVFVSGQGPLNPATGEVLRGPIEEQVHQTMRNLKAILEAAGTSFANVVKTQIYLRDLANFKKMNEVYGEYVGEVPPARTTIQAADLPLGIDVEIDVIALEG